MKLQPHTQDDYAQALLALLPPGKAWEWPEGGFGHSLLRGTAIEPTRIEHDIPNVLQRAIDAHRPRFSSWHISEYQRVAEEALAAAGITETLPRKTCAIGARIGDRLWSANAPNTDFAVPLVQCFHLFAPMSIGRRVGDGSGRDPAARLWSVPRTRYILLVRYYRSVVDPEILRAALEAFRQAHVTLWFEDITGVGGNYAPY
ncbi:MAG: hypothetical protein FWG56_06445 [Desulfovibrionaceae bacterium]|nr:hypothetical protein [Desulfovibrionaceae bacterium]